MAKLADAGLATATGADTIPQRFFDRTQLVSRTVNLPKERQGKAESHKSEHPIRLAGSVLGHHRHICALFNSRDEEYRVLLLFIKEGFEGGKNASRIVNPKRRAEHLER